MNRRDRGWVLPAPDPVDLGHVTIVQGKLPGRPRPDLPEIQQIPIVGFDQTAASGKGAAGASWSLRTSVSSDSRKSSAAARRCTVPAGGIKVTGPMTPGATWARDSSRSKRSSTTRHFWRPSPQAARTAVGSPVDTMARSFRPRSRRIALVRRRGRLAAARSAGGGPAEGIGPGPQQRQGPGLERAESRASRSGIHGEESVEESQAASPRRASSPMPARRAGSPDATRLRTASQDKPGQQGFGRRARPPRFPAGRNCVAVRDQDVRRPDSTLPARARSRPGTTRRSVSWSSPLWGNRLSMTATRKSRTVHRAGRTGHSERRNRITVSSKATRRPAQGARNSSSGPVSSPCRQ